AGLAVNDARRLFAAGVRRLRRSRSVTASPARNKRVAKRPRPFLKAVHMYLNHADGWGTDGCGEPVRDRRRRSARAAQHASVPRDAGADVIHADNRRRCELTWSAGGIPCEFIFGGSAMHPRRLRSTISVFGIGTA